MNLLISKGNFHQTPPFLHHNVKENQKPIVMIQSVIFDVDGTLIDTEFTVKKSLQKLLQERTGKNYSWEELDFILGIPGHITLARFGISDVEQAGRQWNEYMVEFKNRVKVYDGIEETLQQLKAAQITVGLVTSKTRTELNDDFVHFGLMPYFDFYINASDTERHKPFPDPLLKFLEISGITAEQAIYVGDTLYDQQAAAAANIRFGLALWGTKTPDNIEAWQKFAQPGEIFKLINSSRQ